MIMQHQSMTYLIRLWAIRVCRISLPIFEKEAKDEGELLGSATFVTRLHLAKGWPGPQSVACSYEKIVYVFRRSKTHY